MVCATSNQYHLLHSSLSSLICHVSNIYIKMQISVQLLCMCIICLCFLASYLRQCPFVIIFSSIHTIYIKAEYNEKKNSLSKQGRKTLSVLS